MKTWMWAILFLMGCRTPTLSQQEGSISQLATLQLGGEPIITQNRENSFSLAVKDDPATQSTSYIVIRHADKKIVEEGKLQKASLYWIDNLHIGIRITPGIVQKEESAIAEQIIDLTKYITRP
jgi:hypothetical protein